MNSMERFGIMLSPKDSEELKKIEKVYADIEAENDAIKENNTEEAMIKMKAHYRCEKHDYDYQPVDRWVRTDNTDDLFAILYVAIMYRRLKDDESAMRSYGYTKKVAGYYDENDDYYTNVAIDGKETVFTCWYCKKQACRAWSEEEKDNIVPFGCEHCGKIYRIDAYDKPELVEIEEEKPFGEVIADGIKDTIRLILNDAYACMYCIFIIISCFIMAIIVFFFPSANEKLQEKGLIGILSEETEEVNEYFAESPKVHEPPQSIYINEIGRAVYKNDKGLFEDEETGCLFFWNESANPAQWQYWYSGVSDEFTGYGWMRYDANKAEWSIEVSEGTWGTITSPIPDYVWHFDASYVNNYY